MLHGESLQSEHLVAKIGFRTAENVPNLGIVRFDAGGHTSLNDAFTSSLAEVDNGSVMWYKKKPDPNYPDLTSTAIDSRRNHFCDESRREREGSEMY